VNGKSYSMYQTHQRFAQYMQLQHMALHHKLNHKFDKYNNKAIELHKDCDDPKQLKDALSCFLKLLDVTKKNKFAKSCVHHNLGTFYYLHFAHLPGGHAENLNRSMNYFKLALESNERKQFPDKYASTLTQNAVTWRRAATEPLWSVSAEDCYEKAVSLNRRAIKLLTGSVPTEIECSNLAIVYLNLSTVLLDMKQENESCQAAANAFKAYVKSYNLNPIYQRHSQPGIEQMLGVTFSRLNYFGSKKIEHQNTCKSILEFGTREGVDLVMIMGTNPLADTANPETEIMLLYSKALQNNNAESRKRLRQKITNLMKKRFTAETDQSGDRVTQIIQQASSGLARLLVDDNQPLEAFTVLEHASAMRFTEVISACWHVPSNILAFSLLKMQQQFGAWYYNLNETALLCEQIQKDEIKGYLTDIYGQIKYKNEENDFQTDIMGVDTKKYLNVIEMAIKSNEPLTFIKNKASRLLADIHKIEPLLCRLDPSWDLERQKSYVIQKNDFKKVFDLYPNLTLVKIDIETNYSNILIITAYMQEGRLISKGHLIDIPEDVLTEVGEFSYSQKLSNPSKWKLDFIDWKLILPPEAKQVGLLPSFYASSMPWSATGQPGELLLDLTEEVLWLPTIMALYNKVKYFENKKASHTILGGNTLFHKLSHLHINHQANVSEISQIKNIIRTSNVFSYYGHCEHNHPHPPRLLLEQTSISPLEFHQEIRGSERVEFWACQSGCNIPLKYLSSPVNEAFGMDMKMLEFGADTAIGTLWAVPELVTAHIKSYYDLLVRQGVKASKALIQAQRWWINDGADVELALINEIGLPSYLKRLGYYNDTHSAIDAVMGPVLSKQFTHYHDLKGIEQSFKHQSAWAGLRFCGLPENKGVYISKEKMRLEYGDKIELQQMINRLKLTSGFMS